MIFYTLGECPVCMGSSDLLALISKSDEKMFCYCPSCGLAWDEVPESVDEMNSIDFYAPEGARAANTNDLANSEIKNYEETDIYESFDEIL